MAEIILHAGAKVDIPTRDEVRQDIGAAWADVLDAQQRAAVRGIKWMRFPALQGTPASGAISLGEGAHVGPQQGYAWSVRRVLVDGLTSGATPDVINMYRNATTGQPPLWQFNGNNFGYTFGPLEIVLIGGDEIMFASTGTFNATGLIRATGEVVEVPAEMLAKLAF